MATFSIAKRAQVDNIFGEGQFDLTLQLQNNPGGIVGFELHLNVSHSTSLWFNILDNPNNNSLQNSTMLDDSWDLFHNFYTNQGSAPQYGNTNYVIAGFSHTLTPIPGNGILGYIPVSVGNASNGLSHLGPSGTITFKEFSISDDYPDPGQAVMIGDDTGGEIPDGNFRLSTIKVGRKMLGHEIRSRGKKQGFVVGPSSRGVSNSSQKGNLIETLKNKYKK